MTSTIWGWGARDRHTLRPMHVGADVVRWRNVSAGADAFRWAFTAHNVQTHWPKRLQANGMQKHKIALSLRWKRDRLGADRNQIIQIFWYRSIHNGILSQQHDERRSSCASRPTGNWEKREKDGTGRQVREFAPNS